MARAQCLILDRDYGLSPFSSYGQWQDRKLTSLVLGPFPKPSPTMTQSPIQPWVCDRETCSWLGSPKAFYVGLLRTSKIHEISSGHWDSIASSVKFRIVIWIKWMNLFIHGRCLGLSRGWPSPARFSRAHWPSLECCHDGALGKNGPWLVRKPQDQIWHNYWIC